MKRLLGLATVLVLATGSGARAQCYPPQPSHGQGSVSSSRIAPGDCVQFSGSGFRPQSTVAIDDNGEPRGTVRANPQGHFTTTVCFASDTRPGQHVLTATGPTDGGDCQPGPGQRTVSAIVYVLGVSVVDPPDVDENDRGGGGSGGGGSGGGGGGTDVGGVGAGGGGLPRTGDITMIESLAGLLLVLFGTATLIAARPRRRSTSAA